MPSMITGAEVTRPDALILDDGAPGSFACDDSEAVKSIINGKSSTPLSTGSNSPVSHGGSSSILVPPIANGREKSIDSGLSGKSEISSAKSAKSKVSFDSHITIGSKNSDSTENSVNHALTRTHSQKTFASQWSTGTAFVWAKLPFGSGICIPGKYTIPTHILAEMFRNLDRRDSPAHPGKLRYDTVKGSIESFHDILEAGLSDPFQEETYESLEKLKEQAERQLRRTHVHSIEEATIRWNQGFILNSFQVKLGLKERVFFTFDISEGSTWASKGVTWMITIAILTSIVTFVLSSMPDSKDNFGTWVPYVDVLCVCIFTIEYTARLLTVPYARMELLDRQFLEEVILGQDVDKKLLSPWDRLRSFIVSPSGLVDLVSIVPFWIEFSLAGANIFNLMEDADAEGSQTNVLRVFRIVRVIRVFKLGTLTKADLGEDRNMVLQLFGAVITKARPALQLVGVLVVLAMLVFGTLIWFFERGTLFPKDSPNCPVDVVCAEGAIRLRQRYDGSFETSASPFESIPLSTWWVIVTITTVGYGDYYPVTSGGYVVGAITIMYGAMVFALPVGIIGTTFSQAYDQFLTEQTIRKNLEAHEDERSLHAATLEFSAPQSLASGDPPPLVAEMRDAMQQASVAMGISQELVHRWERNLTFIMDQVDKCQLLEDHPCDIIENWGKPVMYTLREHSVDRPMAAKFMAQARAAWHRLLLHTAQAYEDFQITLERETFMNSMHGPMRIGGVQRARNSLDLPSNLPSRTVSASQVSGSQAARPVRDHSGGSLSSPSSKSSLRDLHVRFGENSTATSAVSGRLPTTPEKPGRQVMTGVLLTDVANTPPPKPASVTM